MCVLSNNCTTKVVPIQVPSKYSHLELCVVDILSRSTRTRLFVCYRPPSPDSDQAAVQYIRALCDCINGLYPDNSTVIICGDFNLPCIDWSIDNCSKCRDTTCSGVFLEFFYTHGLQQLVDSPTRFNHTLDLVCCNNYNCVFNTRVREPFSTSDHCQVCFQVLQKSVSDSNVFRSFDFKFADWSSIKAYLNNVDFFQLFNSNQPPSVIMDEFYQIINKCIELYVPQKRNAVSRKSRLVKYPYCIRRLLRKKATAWRIHRTFHTAESLASYKKVASECKSAIYSFMLTYENQLIANANIGSFYRYANSKLRSRSAAGPLCDREGILVTDSLGRASILQQTFTSNFTTDNGILPQVTYIRKSSNILSRIYFTSALVRRAIKRLKLKTKGGPDGIPPSFFINCCDELCYPLSLLFTFSFENSILPAVWLTSFITPIFKKGNPADANNYRPIALTATMCKLMEFVIKDQMVQFLVDKGHISKRQHAFIKHHSTASNLLECLRDWSIGLDGHMQTDVIYIDFAKAFDSIVPSKLLFKLEQYGISGQLLKWLSGFLTNRTQRVIIDYCFSSECAVISGVPQGSVLGPILFLVYINDIDSVCCGNTVLQLFADDAKLFSKINIDTVTSTLQQSLDKLASWAKEWQLSININKCAVLSISNKPQPARLTYFINGIAIPCCSSYVDLGITISCDLSFERHINNIVSKARQRVSTLFRGFLSRNLSTMRLAFISYIRPILEYNGIIWNPCHIYHIDLIENVQRNFTKRIPSISSLPYSERLALLDLDLLELRRLRFDLIYYYKVLNHLTPFNPDEVFTTYLPAARSRSETPYLQKPIKATNRLLSTSFHRNIDAWNALPAALRSSPSLPAFKRGLKQFDLCNHLKGSVI